VSIKTTPIRGAQNIQAYYRYLRVANSRPRITEFDVGLKSAFLGGQPFKVFFLEKFRGLKGADEIRNLLGFISFQKYFRPEYKKSEIDRIFNEQVLNYAENRFQAKAGEIVGKKLVEMKGWEDLINNLVTPFIVTCGFVKEDIESSGVPQDEDLQTIRESFYRFKIIEDWIWHHRYDPMLISY